MSSASATGFRRISIITAADDIEEVSEAKIIEAVVEWRVVERNHGIEKNGEWTNEEHVKVEIY